MNSMTVVETDFSGSHTVPGHELCGERHGHTWRVRVVIATEEESLDGGTLALPAIVAIIRTYHGRDLDRFLPAVKTTAAGLAAFFHERLSDFPVHSIEVMTNDGYGAHVTWVVR